MPVFACCSLHELELLEEGLTCVFITTSHIYGSLTCALFLSILTRNTSDPVVLMPGQHSMALRWHSRGKQAASGRHGVVLGLAHG